MYATRKDFFEKYLDVLDKYVGKLRNRQRELDGLVEKSKDFRKYSQDYIRGTVKPDIHKINEEIDSLRTEGVEVITVMCEEYKKQLLSEDALKGAEITEDAKLFSSGITLTKEDLDAMLERNKGNRTMVQLVCRFAEEHDIQLNARYVGNTETISLISALPKTTEVILKHNGDKMVYENLLGEETLFFKKMSEDK